MSNHPVGPYILWFEGTDNEELKSLVDEWYSLCDEDKGYHSSETESRLAELETRIRHIQCVGK